MIARQYIVLKRLFSIICSIAFPGPTVVRAVFQQVKLIAAMRAVLRFPYFTPIDEQTLRIAMPACEYLRLPFATL